MVSASTSRYIEELEKEVEQCNENVAQIALQNKILSEEIENIKKLRFALKNFLRATDNYILFIMQRMLDHPFRKTEAEHSIERAINMSVEAKNKRQALRLAKAIDVANFYQEPPSRIYRFAKFLYSFTKRMLRSLIVLIYRILPRRGSA